MGNDVIKNISGLISGDNKVKFEVDIKDDDLIKLIIGISVALILAISAGVILAKKMN